MQFYFIIIFISSGFLIEFIAAPVIAGFTTAAALAIGTSQVKSLLGLKFEAESFVSTWAAVFEHIRETRIWDAVMGFSCITLLLLLRVSLGLLYFRVYWIIFKKLKLILFLKLGT